MAAKDGSMAFEFGGIYTNIKEHRLIEQKLDDERKVKVEFKPDGGKTKVVEAFDAESTNPVEMQRAGWQAILDNFKKHVERLNEYEQLDFSITINAPKKKVWDIMLGAETYKEWVSAAWPGSYAEGKWEPGGTLCFFNPEKSGTKVKLLEHRPYTFSKAEHISSFNKGVEDTTSETAKSWIGSTESYLFSEKEGTTSLEVTMHVPPAWAGMFKADWLKALKKLKAICE